MNELFYELIRVSIGNTTQLSRLPSAKEWMMLYNMAEKQSVVGVCFAGVRKLCNPDEEYFAGMSELMYLTWMGMAAEMQQRNEEMNKWTAELHKKVTSSGYPACVLKGQAVNALYDNLQGLRQAGDIDVWMVAEPNTVIEWARATGRLYYYDYHHADLSSSEDAEIELHYRPTLSRNLIRNSRLQTWFKEEGTKHILFDNNLGFSVPDYTFNVILTLNHNFWHLLYEGVGMRQVMDLYFILKSTSFSPVEGKKEEILKLIKHLKLLKFTSASMWIMKEIFGLEDKYLLCEPDERAGKFLLDEIMQAGNFGKHDNRLKKGRYKNRVALMLTWIRHTLRLFKYYPADVLWTPIGILRISLWRRRHYRNELKEM